MCVRAYRRTFGYPITYTVSLCLINQHGVSFHLPLGSCDVSWLMVSPRGGVHSNQPTSTNTHVLKHWEGIK